MPGEGAPERLGGVGIRVEKVRREGREAISAIELVDENGDAVQSFAIDPSVAEENLIATAKETWGDLPVSILVGVDQLPPLPPALPGKPRTDPSEFDHIGRRAA